MLVSSDFTGLLGSRVPTGQESSNCMNSLLALAGIKAGGVLLIPCLRTLRTTGSSTDASAAIPAASSVYVPPRFMNMLSYMQPPTWVVLYSRRKADTRRGTQGRQSGVGHPHRRIGDCGASVGPASA